MKVKIIVLSIVLLIVFATRFILWDFNVSTGKRVGNLVKISKKGKLWLMQTWELTLDEGSGDKLTSYLSVKDDVIAEELYKYEGKQVVLFYEEHLLGFPRDTKYVVTSWKPQDEVHAAQIQSSTSSGTINNALVESVQKTLFCSFLGSLKKNQKLYQDVKDFIQQENIYLFNQYKKCND